ncbi:hypothetical protein [Streptomyces rochei]|uniref:hypothetical protein n=1 Tax=Streptomyces rochei TaxID=1928 RepID=UPI004063B553
MAVMTHAPARLEANYRSLSTDDQDRFDQLMERADHAGPHDYQPLMDALAVLTGLFTARDIARCSCWTDTRGCGCAVIFDTALPGVVVTATNDPDCNLSQLQCPTCGHDHPRPITD